MVETRARWRNRLPHWEVKDRPHFVTIRCAGSLPPDALARVSEIQRDLERIPARSPQFATLQRKYFKICENYLDAGYGPCPFNDSAVCALAIEGLEIIHDRSAWFVTDYTLMPNHVHLLLVPSENSAPLGDAIRGWKWYVAREGNRILGRCGRFWQTDWFDRWARTDAEVDRMRAYIRENPVKARLVSQWQDYAWTRSAIT